MTLQDEQMQREKQSVSQGKERLATALEKDRAAGRTYDNPVGQAQLRRVIENSHENIAELRRLVRKDKLARAMREGRRSTECELMIFALDVDTLTFVAVRTLMNAVGRGKSEQDIGKTIGNMLELQFKWTALRKAEAARVKGDDPKPHYNRLQLLKREVKQINPKNVRKWLKKLDDLVNESWSQHDKTALGLQLVEAIYEPNKHFFEREIIVRRRGKAYIKKSVLVFSDLARNALENQLRGTGANQPWLLPMVCPPKDWSDDQMGGYMAIPVTFVKDRTDNTEEPAIPAAMYDAVNAIQRTGWAVNEAVLHVAKEAHKRGLEAILPVNPVRAVPPEVSPEEWEALDDEGRSNIKAERRTIHDSNFKLESKRQVINRQLDVAQDLVGRTFYFPHNVDFRGRVYPLPQDLHPQADDFGKALLTFAEAKPLGQRGFAWLQYQVASTYGLDKASRDEQLDWCAENISGIKMLAANPFGDMLDWWAKAEEPWQFFAAVVELTNAMDHGADDYECALPIHVDGSCNGLQHLSAMGRDAVGAKAVNLMPGERQDIYQIVADKVNAAVRRDEVVLIEGEKGRDEACAWYDKVTRKVVKRGVMTKPYGLTHVGMRDQLIDDRNKCWADVDGDVRKNATYLRDLMAKAIEDTVHASVHVMDWMQACSKALADADQGIRWTNPIGFTVDQRYINFGTKVYTVVGVGLRTFRRKMHIATQEGPLLITKQVQAVAPNIVHSFDAAHMQLSIAKAAELTNSFSAVHDSFGVHACDMDEFLEVIKDTFIEMYSAPVLDELYQEFLAQAPEGVVIPEPPALGDFEVGEVAASDWFFA